MSEASAGTGLLAETGPEQKHGIVSSLTKFFVHYPLGAGAMCVLVAIVGAAFFAPWFVPFDPLEADFGSLRAGPSGDHWMGTDRLGRDVFSRVLYGARSTLVIAFIAVAIGDGFGFTIGIISAYAGGRFDLISQRVLEACHISSGMSITKSASRSSTSLASPTPVQVSTSKVRR